jgi:hypothetical protein
MRYKLIRIITNIFLSKLRRIEVECDRRIHLNNIRVCLFVSHPQGKQEPFLIMCKQEAK